MGIAFVERQIATGGRKVFAGDGADSRDASTGIAHVRMPLVDSLATRTVLDSENDDRKMRAPGADLEVLDRRWVGTEHIVLDCFYLGGRRVVVQLGQVPGGFCTSHDARRGEGVE